MKVLVLVANGSEDIETVGTIDLLTRANIDVVLASVGAVSVKCAVKTQLTADIEFNSVKDFAEFEMIILPGGTEGSKTFKTNAKLQEALKQAKRIGAICAAPTALGDLLKGKHFTCYPQVASTIKQGTFVDQAVVVDGKIITSQGPATVFDFALKIIEILKSKAIRDQVAASILYQENL